MGPREYWAARFAGSLTGALAVRLLWGTRLNPARSLGPTGVRGREGVRAWTV